MTEDGLCQGSLKRKVRDHTPSQQADSPQQTAEDIYGRTLIPWRLNDQVTPACEGIQTGTRQDHKPSVFAVSWLVITERMALLQDSSFPEVESPLPTSIAANSCTRVQTPTPHVSIGNNLSNNISYQFEALHYARSRWTCVWMI